MDFMQSETRINLARAFAGESQARNRYTIYADIAPKRRPGVFGAHLFWKRQTMKRCMERNFWR